VWIVEMLVLVFGFSFACQTKVLNFLFFSDKVLTRKLVSLKVRLKFRGLRYQKCEFVTSG
jgi:hypothetical protein